MARIATTNTIAISIPRSRGRMPALAGGAIKPEEPEAPELARGGRLDAQPLGGPLQVIGPAFGQRERGVGHLPDPGPLLGAPGGRQRALEVGPGRLGVVTLGCPIAEDRLRGRLVPGLGLELLVGLALELLHRGQLAPLLDSRDPLLLGHGKRSLAAPGHPGSRSLTPGNGGRSDLIASRFLYVEYDDGEREFYDLQNDPFRARQPGRATRSASCDTTEERRENVSRSRPV